MRHVVLSLLLAGACSHSQKAPKTEAIVSPPEWGAAASMYFNRIADAMDASREDCAKLVEALKPLDKESHELAKLLVDASHELHDHVIDGGTATRLAKHSTLFDRCENEKTPGFAEVLIATLFVVEPYKPGRTDSAYSSFFVPK